MFGRPGLDALLDRFHYTIELAMVGVITGQVGSGKSTSLRCAASRLHPSAFRLLAVLASAGTYMELLRGIAAAAGLQHRVTSTVTLTTTIRDLGRDPERWRAWISNQGPVLVRLVVDRTWERATAAGGELDRYREDTSGGGHAACLVGYTRTHFIVRNSWGQRWGDGGFAYASDAYAASAFGEAYGAVP